MSVLNTTLDIIHRLTSTDPRVRGLAADEVTDLLRSLGAADPVVTGPVVARVLAMARLVETDEAAQESQLNALAELKAWDLAPPEVGDMLTHLDRARLRGSQIEYLEELIEEG